MSTAEVETGHELADYVCVERLLTGDWQRHELRRPRGREPLEPGADRQDVLGVAAVARASRRLTPMLSPIA